MYRNLTPLALATLVILPLVSCDYAIQTTSGESYLKRYGNMPAVASHSTEGVNIEKAIRQVAAVEPILTFPARIGIARIHNGWLTAIPPGEAEAWIKLAEELGPDTGEFIPVSRLVAEMVSGSVATTRESRIVNVMNKVRLGAARQHLDAVLIYEVHAKTNRDWNILAIADLTIVGAWILPSRFIEADGFANAMLIDVVQGYPYGTAEATVKKNGAAPAFIASDQERSMSIQVMRQATEKLSQEVKMMFETLRKQLQERRTAQN